MSSSLSAPGPGPESKIVPMTAAAAAEGQRSLAAIVFTDAVDFSALMSRDEDRARRLISRDLGDMRIICARFEGEVLKSNGDGLMLLFTSAVQAVSCALEIQAYFRAQNRSNPSSERLRHRLGIHLGDVIRQHGDVMGDGVNIASRLQGEAAPGGVCVSNTVYEVVKNRLAISVVSRKARKLKNVGTIVVYQIARRQAGYEFLRWMLNLILIRKKTLIIILAIFLAFWVADYFSSKPTEPYHDALSNAAPDLNPLGPVSALAAADGDIDAFFDSATKASAPPGRTGMIPATDEDFYIARFNNMKNYDFSSMRTWLEKHDPPDLDGARLIRVLLSMQELLDWCYSHLPAYSCLHPLVIRNEHEDLELWMGPAGEIILKIHGAVSSLARNQVPPGLMAEIAVQLLDNDAPANVASTRELWRGLESFLASYRIQSERLRDQVDAGAR